MEGSDRLKMASDLTSGMGGREAGGGVGCWQDTQVQCVVDQDTPGLNMPLVSSSFLSHLVLIPYSRSLSYYSSQMASSLAGIGHSLIANQ
jgi:hypothetical protein